MSEMKITLYTLTKKKGGGMRKGGGEWLATHTKLGQEAGYEHSDSWFRQLFAYVAHPVPYLFFFFWPDLSLTYFFLRKTAILKWQKGGGFIFLCNRRYYLFDVLEKWPVVTRVVSHTLTLLSSI
jgi:hypothetical protein